MWLYYKPNNTSNQHYHYGSADIAATTPSQTTPRTPNAEASLPVAKLPPNQDKATVQIVDKRTPIPSHSLLVIAEEKPTVKTESAAIQDTSSKSELAKAVEDSLPKEHPQAGEETLVQTSELELDVDTDLEPALTEEEAISLAIETALAKNTMMEVSTGELEDSVPELIRPKPPNPELVEAAVRDAEEKLEDFSPPEIADDVSQV
ncbi:hypothetical protein [Chlorogloea sp. CCALA 695]|nr:hypothetical protein C7B70_11825 [Chlorogloea sp. CCALA 695]